MENEIQVTAWTECRAYDCLHMHTNNGCESAGVIRSFIIWAAHPDADRILVQDLNEAF